MLEYFKVLGLCIVSAVMYGIIHDQFTARICVEYFTVFHPPILSTDSPTLLAFGWGILATWWVGAFLGAPLALVARAGRWPTLTARDLAPWILRLMLVMACCAILAGIFGYRRGTVPEDVQRLLPPERHRLFVADWWAHNASYASGFLGGLFLWIAVPIKRWQLSKKRDC